MEPPERGGNKHGMCVWLRGESFKVGNSGVGDIRVKIRGL
ncbi:hypothetical protein A2U01_0095995, partial [Trifolium medium]|nr:hypothetical protein [Trifolium medium]